ncbi:MAG: hypothetical protein SFH39_15210 [Candidatus Magnetobacterium sp. LHC-1]|nr:hypothetical protein [Nitrospirota bacterium]
MESKQISNSKFTVCIFLLSLCMACCYDTFTANAGEGAPPDNDAVVVELKKTVETDLNTTIKARQEKKKQRCVSISYCDSLWQSSYNEYTGEFSHDIQKTTDPLQPYTAEVKLLFYKHSEVGADGQNIEYESLTECEAKVPKSFRKISRLSSEYIFYTYKDNKWVLKE